MLALPQGSQSNLANPGAPHPQPSPARELGFVTETSASTGDQAAPLTAAGRLIKMLLPPLGTVGMVRGAEPGGTSLALVAELVGFRAQTPKTGLKSRPCPFKSMYLWKSDGASSVSQVPDLRYGT